ncbi:plasma membrane glucose/fructose:proton symporter Ght2 [Schizosaccharomyces pombe]|uniref:High-affinity glucose transporter ght2 n=1 Tax=Schizosaccharomyces pombe (strain 972 / ATCC 24843) TaxID=284812 RepID=GHT2_SCHPO|nr:hexose transporter Ght2 [Schizosaccharomyces pombe]O74969.1 RecName: Full=High-affinity glucose transporter ght2; AltName: Full=Hexose transporter 2 [Schizosaccharomyces pombe 972h-]CAA19288.1 hexose transporter Ght2 [Schizosaccharomyces pombe]|eukprot:NP_596425.1 hexose transporter Ght2 [Schizosaccharomyces pombe]
MGFKRGKNFTLVMLIFVSMAGWMFGADTGSIGGVTSMRDFRERYADRYDPITDQYSLSSARQGLLTGMVNVGSLFGCIISSPIADRFGKRLSIIGFCAVYIIGIIVQVTAVPSWVQIMVAKIWTGIGIGALSVLAPGYQSETAPPSIRGTVVVTYQLFVTGGIFIAACINMGTHKLHKTAQWRVSIGINLLWGIITMIGILFLPESPRYLIQVGKDEEAVRVLSESAELFPDSEEVQNEYHRLKSSIDEEFAGGPCSWASIFGKDIRYRTFLGMFVMSLQQLTGNNYFFYYGFSVMQGAGINSPYLSAMILDAVNFGCTFGGMYVLERFGRRNPLIIGGIWQSICFFIYSAVGSRALYHKNGTSNTRAGAVMIVMACLFIFGFAQTWAPAAYVIVGESYPVRYRSKCAAVATASNWLWNFLISFFTPFIQASIGFKYGYVFASCNLTGAIVIFLFAKETKGLTLEEINELYMSVIKPWESGNFKLNYSEQKKVEKEKSRKGGARGESVEYVERASNTDSSPQYSSHEEDYA